MGMRKRGFRFFGRRGLSPIFATMLLAAIVIVFGSVAYYFSSNLTNTVTNNYSSTSSNSQQSVAERISFENVQYSSSTLTIYILNSGGANSLQINAVYIYDSTHNIVGQPFSGGQISALQTIPGGSPTPSPIVGNSLNVGQEAYFTINGVSLNSGSAYTLDLITKSGSNFNYEFTA